MRRTDRKVGSRLDSRHQVRARSLNLAATCRIAPHSASHTHNPNYSEQDGHMSRLQDRRSVRTSQRGPLRVCEDLYLRVSRPLMHLYRSSEELSLQMHGPPQLCCMHAPSHPMIMGSKDNTGLETAQGLPTIRVVRASEHEDLCLAREDLSAGGPDCARMVFVARCACWPATCAVSLALCYLCTWSATAESHREPS